MLTKQTLKVYTHIFFVLLSVSPKTYQRKLHRNDNYDIKKSKVVRVDSDADAVIAVRCVCGCLPSSMSVGMRPRDDLELTSVSESLLLWT